MDDLIITVHALERMTERWGFTDKEIVWLRREGPKGKLSPSQFIRWKLIEKLSDTEVKKFQICNGLDDEEIARVIQGEVNDALISGKKSRICPLELANSNVNRWKAEKDVWYLWNEDKSRGYVISEKEDGITVLTTLIGQDKELAKRKLQKR